MNTIPRRSQPARVSLSLGLGLTLAAAWPATTFAAVDVRFDFDSLASGSLANLGSRAGITFEPAVYQPLLDDNGITIPGSDRWRIDGTADPVTVDNPADFGRGAAPSPVNALNAVFQPVLIRFADPETVRWFSVGLDGDRFGDPATSIGFYDSAGALLGEIPLDQTLPNGSFAAAFDLTGVKDVVLPGGAFYDNITISSVPEPGPLSLLMLGGLGLAASRRGRRGGHRSA